MDTVADALIRIKNGYQVGKTTVSLRFSNLVWKLTELLKKEGYLSNTTKKEREIVVTLKYNSRIPVLTDIKRVSKPGLRVYKGVKQLPSVLNGHGVAIISTPKGLMTDTDARKSKVGGEVVALVW